LHTAGVFLRGAIGKGWWSEGWHKVRCYST